MSLDGWKRASFLVGSSSRQGSQTAPSPQQNSRALKDGPSLRATAPKLALFQPSRHTNGASATPKQQGPEGRTEPPGNGSHCLTLLSEPTRKLESNVRQWERLPGGSVRPSGPCCLGVAEAPFVSLDGWKRASLGAVARRLGPSFRALLFCCGEGAVCEP